jgi:hypothetical protein
MNPTAYTLLGLGISILLALFGYTLYETRERAKGDRDLGEAVARVESTHEALCSQHEKYIDRIPIIEEKMDTAIGAMDVYFKMMDKYLANAIHSPNHKERDDLMDKLQWGTITLPEVERLALLVGQMLNEEKDPFRYFAGAQTEARLASLRWRMQREQTAREREQNVRTT